MSDLTNHNERDRRGARTILDAAREQTMTANDTEIAVKPSSSKGRILLRVGEEVIAMTPEEAGTLAAFLGEAAQVVRNTKV